MEKVNVHDASKLKQKNSGLKLKKAIHITETGKQTNKKQCKN